MSKEEKGMTVEKDRRRNRIQNQRQLLKLNNWRQIKMNQSIKKNIRNLLNLFLVALFMFMTFGCSGAVDGFKQGYNEATENSNGNTTANSKATNIANTTDNSNTTGDSIIPDNLITPDNSNTTDNSSTPDSSSKTETSGKLADEIVGKWEMTTGGKKLVFEFRADKTVESFVDGKKTSGGTYSIIDEKTIETKNTDGTVTETIPIKIEGTKMTMTYNNTNLTFTKK